ncbi:aminomethyl-transferring glycine dehydrogenase subunit GcvPA [Marinilactibacillus kalidii]|uniref:aminomethyl-transferring glycine dehydrogenase subunit GcvPA n=1 Tax=Marinilactibacillus kalidii TaxID=2820274 RepID=UPI001ABE22DA|nr:aminomethyl-transferring glycine dehydrogenase subunit GcvPA [Marinilactibacillus kalidii]
MTKQHRYLPTTDQDQKEMLKTIGVESISDLFSDIPVSTRATNDKSIDLPDPLSEYELTKHMKKLADQNKTATTFPFFLGAGTYDHFIPSVVNHVTLKSEFMTAYTPYQPEASQGELQALFEFQTMICALTGMDVSNSSLYDGFTSLGEACNLATSVTKNNTVLMSAGIHPQAKEVVRTYAYGMEYKIKEVPLNKDITDISQLKTALSEDTAAVIVQYPNFLGSVEDLAEIKETLKDTKALLIVVANPLALAKLEAPGNLGADIVVGDMQPLGLSMSFGGPHCGYFTVTSKYMRKIPSRIVGETVDIEGKRGFVMTLQTREQHIRREKATSNMSSNQALNALASAVFMTALGKEGVQEMAQQNINKAHFLAKKLKQSGMDIWNEKAYFNEFVIECAKSVSAINQGLLEKGFIGGYDVSEIVDRPNAMLLCATEKRTREEIISFVEALVEVNQA